jgi:hypothetical protein
MDIRDAKSSPATSEQITKSKQRISDYRQMLSFGLIFGEKLHLVESDTDCVDLKFRESAYGYGILRTIDMQTARCSRGA